MKKAILGMAAVLVLGLVLAGQTVTVEAFAPNPAVCPIADDETLTQCRVTSAHSVASGTYNFHKTLHIENGGSITAPSGANALTLNIDGSMLDPDGDTVPNPGPGHLLMDTNASMIITDDIQNDPGPSAAPINITTSGNVIMQAGSLISARNFGVSGGAGGGGGWITIDVNGDKMVMCGPATNVAFDAACSTNAVTGATITTDKNGGGTGNAGNITILVGNLPAIAPYWPPALPPEGEFLMDTGAIIRANAPTAGGDIVIKAGLSAEIDGHVLSQVLSGSTGPGGNGPRDGGTIFIDVGCVLHVSETGLISSSGQDQGADLVHLSGCKVLIDGKVESTGSGHGVPGNPVNSCDHDYRLGKPENSTGCVEVWGREIEITETGEINADVNDTGTGGPEGESWVDLFALEKINIAGKTGAADLFAVHADTYSGSDHTPNTITAKVVNGTATMSGKALSASVVIVGENGNGSWGGAIVVEANQLVNLDNATLHARGDNVGGGIGSPPPCDGGQGSCGKGGTIDVRSFNAAISWQNGVGDVNPDRPPDPGDPPNNQGFITLTACTTVTTFGTNFDDAVPTVKAVSHNGVLLPPNSEQCGGAPVLPTAAADQYDVIFHTEIWEHCSPPATKSGMKFEDLDRDGIKDAGEPGIANWPIYLMTVGNAVLASTTTAGDGSYSFTGLTAGMYRVCEGTGPAPGPWTQSFPNMNSPTPPGETKTDQCPAPNKWGYDFTVGANGTGGGSICCPNGGGQNFTGNDFGNHSGVVCPEDLPRGPQLTRTVNPSKALGGGGVAGNPANYHTLQAAYDVARLSPATKDEVIGMFSKTKENVILNYYYAKSMTITQCTSAEIKDNSYGTLPVWRLTSSRKLLIIGPDSVGGTIGWSIETGTHELKSIRSNGASVAGVRILTDKNSVSFNNVATSGVGAIGVDILGNSNIIKSGTIGPNSGAGIHIGAGKTKNEVSGATIQNNGNNGIWVEGSANIIKSNKLKENSPSGIKVTGSTNTIQSNGSDENNGDGYNIAGSGNILKDNKANDNTQDGFELSGTGQKLTGSASNQATNDYKISAPAAVSGPSGNKSDGSSVPTGKCTGLFTNPGVLTCN